MSKPFLPESFYNVLFYSTITTVATFLLILVVLVYKYDLLADFTVTSFDISNETFVFVPYKGDYGKMNHLFKKIQKDYSTASEKASSSGAFHGGARICTICYDQMNKKKKGDGRAVAGVLVKGGDASSEEAVGKMNRMGYVDTFQFEKLRVVGATFPLYNFLNVIFGLFRGLPMIERHLKEHKDKRDADASGDYPIVHVYDYSLHKYIIAAPLQGAAAVPQFDKLYETHKDK